MLAPESYKYKYVKPPVQIGFKFKTSTHSYSCSILYYYASRKFVYSRHASFSNLADFVLYMKKEYDIKSTIKIQVYGN